MKISGDWLTRPETQAICAALTDAGHRALFVGGCVRNTLLDEPVADVDIATDAEPGTVTKLAEAAGLRAIPTGIEHGTVTVVSGGIPHEVTTFRRDVEAFGRHAKVAFSTHVEDDAARRDFTMNALYATPQGEVIDPLGGLADVLARRLRFVGDPDQRIAEDFLRILRFFRFHAWYGDPTNGLDAEGLAACAANSAGIDTLSRERIGAEMRKLLTAPDPSRSVAAMARSGILGRVLPGADDRALPILVHLEEDIGPNWLRRLAVLGGSEPSDRLRLSRADTAILSLLREEVASTRSPAELAYRFGPARATDIVLARAAMLETTPGQGWQAQIETGALALLPVSAADLMPDFTGPALGERLRELQDRWIASDFRLTRSDLLA